MSVISIEGLSKGAVLAALYNGSKIQGLGFLQANDESMTTEGAEELLSNHTYFDYLYGRVMKIDLLSDLVFESALYDRDNAAQYIIDVLRSTDNVNAEEIKQTHLENTYDAAVDMNEAMNEDESVIEHDGWIEVGLTPKPFADILKPIIDEILGNENNE